MSFQPSRFSQSNPSSSLQPLHDVGRIAVVLLLLFITAKPVCGAKYVVAWGDDAHGQTSVPPGITNAIAVAVGSNASFVLRADGLISAWGSGSAATNPPVLQNISAIAAGENHALALRTDGTVVGWGDNAFGQVNIPLSLTNTAAVSAGGSHSLALGSNGLVYAWGNPQHGRTTVPAGLADVTAIAAGRDHCVALRSNGSVVAWGSNATGQTNVPVGLSNVVSIAAGDLHSLAAKADGTVVIWGGYTVPSGITDIVRVIAPNLGLKSNGTLVNWSWPVGNRPIPSGLSNVISAAAGNHHTLAVVEVTNGTPTITRHPNSAEVFRGAAGSLNITAEGAPVPSCQWQKDGTNIPGATSFSFSMPNIQVEDSGDYRAVVSNANGSATSLLASLLVLEPEWPYIFAEPVGGFVHVGSNYTLTVGVTGSAWMRYQWRFKGTNLAGATNSSLVLTGIQFDQEGEYDVAVTNELGWAMSARPYVNVFDLAEALNTNMVWNVGGDQGWYAEASGYSLVGRSGSITNGQSSVLQTTIQGPGRLQFDWTVSCVPEVDYLSFSVNGSEQKRISGTLSWQTETFYLGAGAQILEWRYSQGSSGTSRADRGRVDFVRFTSGITLPTITMHPRHYPYSPGQNLSFDVAAYGSAPLTYQWQHRQLNIPGETNSILTISNTQPHHIGNYRVLVSNPYGSATAMGSLFDATIGSDVPHDALDKWYYSPGTNWTEVRFAGGRFFALGTNGALATSIDGKTWSPKNSGVTSNLNGVVHASGLNMFVGVGSGGTVIRSLDGTNWNALSINSQNLTDIAWNGSRFVITANALNSAQNNVFYSTDGVNWIGANFPVSRTWLYFSHAIGTRGSYFLASGGEAFADDLWRSLDGSSWQKVGNADAVVDGIATGNGRMVVIGWEGWPRVSTSPLLTTWTFTNSSAITPSTPPYQVIPMVGSDIAFGNGSFLVTRSWLKNGLLTSKDGLTWSNRPVFTGADVRSVAFGNGRFVVVCTGGTYPAGLYASENVAIPMIAPVLDNNAQALRLSVSGEVGRAYRLQWSENLQSWSNVVSYTSGGETNFYPVLDPGVPQKFYRVVSP